VLEVSRQTVGMYQNRYLLRVRSILDFRVENLMEGRLVGHRMDVFSGPRLRRLGRGWLAGESGTRQSMRCNSVISSHIPDIWETTHVDVRVHGMFAQHVDSELCSGLGESHQPIQSNDISE